MTVARVRIWMLLGCLLPVPATAMTLSEALQAAIEHDPVVRRSLAQYDAERERGRQVSGTLLPGVFVDGQATYNSTKIESEFFGQRREEFPAHSFGLEVRQPLFRLDWFQRGRHAAALDTLADAALAERGQALLIYVASRYFGVLRARDELLVAEAETRAVSEAFEDTRKRYEVQLVAGTDLREAQARDDLAQARLLAARQALEDAQDMLDETTGRGRERLPTLPPEAELPKVWLESDVAWEDITVQHSPVLAQARAEVAVARGAAERARADVWPQVDLVAGLRRDDTSESVIGQKRDAGQIMAELRLPLYQGGIGSARMREADGRLREAEAELLRVTGELRREARTAHRSVRTAAAQVRAFAVAVESAIAAEQATRHGYEAGTRTITDVLDAQSHLAQARRDHTRARFDLVLSWMRLQQVVGRLGPEDFAQVDSLLRQRADGSRLPDATTNRNIDE